MSLNTNIPTSGPLDPNLSTEKITVLKELSGEKVSQVLGIGTNTRSMTKLNIPICSLGSGKASESYTLYNNNGTVVAVKIDKN